MYNFKKLKQLRRKATNDENTNGRVVRDTGIQPKDPQTAIQESEEKRKSFRSLIGPEGPGMKRLRAKQDAIPMTDKSGRVSRSRMQKKFGRFINTEEHMSEEESYAKIDSFHAHPDGKFTIGVKHKAKKVMHTGSMQHLQKVTKKYPLKSRVSVHSVKTGRENMKEEHLIEDGHTDVASALRKCKTIMEDASDIHTKLAMMGTMDSLPSWWTNKLAVAAAYMDSMRDYLLYPTNEEVKDQKYLKKLKQTKNQATLGDMSTGIQKGGFQGRGMYEAKKVKVMKKVAKDKIIGKKDPFEPEPDITTQVIRTDSPDNVVK